MPDMRPPHALSGERLVALGATRDSTTGCWGLPFVRRAVVLCLSTALLSAVPAGGAQTSGEKLDERLEDLRARAEQGDASAQFILGVRYANGEGIPEDDREAVRWYRLAAEQGNTSAQSNLGTMYATGRGVPEDDREAVRWYRLAAEQGDATAQLNLGNMSARGGSPRCIRAAMHPA